MIIFRPPRKSLVGDSLTSLLNEYDFAIQKMAQDTTLEIQSSLSSLIPISKFYRALSGFEPDKFSSTILNINPGFCSNSNSTQIFSTSTLFAIDISTVGVNGLDTGIPVNGTDYYVYLISNDNVTVKGIISNSITYSGVVLPASYSHVRKLPFGFIYNTIWGGIPDFHLTHWPMPFIRLTGSEQTGTWQALVGGVAAIWTTVNLAPWIPDNARQAYIYTVVGNSGVAGSAFIRVLGSQLTGLNVGSSSPVDTLSSYGSWFQRITSTRQLQYQVTGGANLSIYVLGYSMTEPI